MVHTVQNKKSIQSGQQSWFSKHSASQKQAMYRPHSPLQLPGSTKHKNLTSCKVWFPVRHFINLVYITYQFIWNLQIRNSLITVADPGGSRGGPWSPLAL